MKIKNGFVCIPLETMLEILLKLSQHEQDEQAAFLAGQDAGRDQKRQTANRLAAYEKAWFLAWEAVKPYFGEFREETNGMTGAETVAHIIKRLGQSRERARQAEGQEP